MPLHQGNKMSNKPHLRPHEKERRARQVTRLLVAILILAFFALAVALEMTGHFVFRGRLILGCWLRRADARPIAARDRHRHQGVNSLQCPSETISTAPSVTLMAV
jgi:hypothetical protein